MFHQILTNFPGNKTMSFISFSLSIEGDLLSSKIAVYTFISTIYETETLTYLFRVNTRNLN